jgi:DNA replication protein DnaD
LIVENPEHKDQILSIVTKTLDQQLTIWEKSLSKEEIEFRNKNRLINDLNEIKLVSENKTIDKIKTLKSVNKSHSNLLEEIKKAKTKNIDTDHYDNTMDLFD